MNICCFWAEKLWFGLGKYFLQPNIYLEKISLQEGHVKVIVCSSHIKRQILACIKTGLVQFASVLMCHQCQLMVSNSYTEIIVEWYDCLDPLSYFLVEEENFPRK